jgi:hypothetical protein
MEGVKIKSGELIGVALNWAVAAALNGSSEFFDIYGAKMLGKSLSKEALAGNINPSENWIHGGRLIDKFAIGFVGHDADNWLAFSSPADATHQGIGPTHLIAACRMIVNAKLGETILVPKELVK